MDMALSEISKKMQASDVVDWQSTLPENTRLQELTADLLNGCGETIYLRDSEGIVQRKIKKELLEYLRAQRQTDLLAQILNGVQDGVIAVDAAGRIFYLNRAYTEILKVKPYKILGEYIQSVEPNSMLTQVLRRREAVESTARLIASVNKYVSLRIVPLFSGSVFAGAVAFFRDVTELHDLDKEVKKMTGIVGEYSKQLRNMTTVQSMGILTQNRAYLTMLEQAAVVAHTDVPVLIRGENGVGKEVLANYIRQCSDRKDKPMITVNCAAIPAELLESELFGYEEGAFTGAVKGGRKGKFELADKGTIFLDEIGDMPLTMQSKLLRVIQQGEIEKLGRQHNLRVDVRILTATNQPLEQLIEEKRFRQDLFYRLNIFTLRIPPLRERPDDVVLLAVSFVKLYNQKYGKDLHLSKEICQYLQQQSWPGNVLELQGCIERAVILGDESLLMVQSQPEEQCQALSAETEVPHGELRQLLADYEGDVLRRTLEACGGNRSKAMEQLGLSRRTFYRKCAEHGVFSV